MPNSTFLYETIPARLRGIAWLTMSDYAQIGAGTVVDDLGGGGTTDDPVHPLEVGLEWVAAAPRAALRTVTLVEMGTDPSVLGAACVAALWDV